jgi:hypothetical protein
LFQKSLKRQPLRLSKRREFMKISRGKIKIFSIPCLYCTRWIEAERSGYQDQEENNDEPKRQRKSEGTRKCLLTKKEISLHTNACEDFSLHHDFWCKRNEYWLDIKSCLSRQEKQLEGCQGCKQGSLILTFSNMNKENKNENNIS